MSPSDQLSQREIQVATMVWEGKINPEIAAVVASTEQVVKNQLRRNFDKSGVWNRLELALYVASHGGGNGPRASSRGVPWLAERLDRAFGSGLALSIQNSAKPGTNVVPNHFRDEAAWRPSLTVWGTRTLAAAPKARGLRTLIC